MPSYVTVTVDISDLTKQLKKYGLRDRNINMNVAALALETAMDDVLDSQGAKGADGKWAPFKVSTFRVNPKRIGGMLLQDTGLLAAFMHRVTPREAEVFSPAPYAGYHVNGTSNMVKRDFTAVRWGPLLEDIADSMMVEVVKG